MTSIMGLLWALLLFCSEVYSYGCSNNPYIKDAGPLVRTASGAVVGKYIKVSDTEVAAFLGLPYAKPPINENRFLKPKPLERWDGILEATEKPRNCMQFSSRNFSWIPRTTPSEDCLYLNVWAPVKCCCIDEEKLPVLVWIYGGGFYSGSTDMDVYDGSTLAAYSKSIVVTMNYRLGIFGFLDSGNEDAPGNAGLWDQYLALKWVKNNIGFFGGDTHRITIMGESAGAISVSLHMISPISRIGLFNRAILQSSTAYNPGFIDSPDGSHVKANTFAKIVGCLTENSSVDSDPEVVECLKNKNALELAKAEDIFTSKFPMYFFPTYGNEYLPTAPIKAVNEGHISPVDILIGNNRDEATIFLNYIFPDIFKTDSEPQLNLNAAENIISALFQTVPQPPSKVIFEQYFKNTTDNDSVEIVKAIVSAFGDYVFNCPVQYFAEKARNAFVYWFTHRSTRIQHHDWIGVPHFYEVPFVFGVPIHDTNTYTPEDGKFSEDIITKWSTFAQKGHPLGDEYYDDWPLFTADQHIAFELNPREEGILTFPRAPSCEFWKPYITPESC